MTNVTKREVLIHRLIENLLEANATLSDYIALIHTGRINGQATLDTALDVDVDILNALTRLNRLVGKTYNIPMGAPETVHEYVEQRVNRVRLAQN